jgi:hypothetical protein
MGEGRREVVDGGDVLKFPITQVPLPERIIAGSGTFKNLESGSIAYTSLLCTKYN